MASIQTSPTSTSLPENNPKTFNIPVAVAVVKSILLTFFMVVGLFGNFILSIIISRRRELRTRTNTFYVNLAVANIGIAAVCIPFTLSTLFSGEWKLGKELCRVNAVMNSFLISACAFSLTATTIHKYFSVVKPLKRVLTKRRVYLMLFMVWFVSALVSIWPNLHVDEIVYKHVSGQCGLKHPDSKYDVYYLLFLSCIVFICPTLINMFCYLRIFRALRQHQRRLKRSTIIDATGIRAQKQTIITLYAVFVVFLVTWLPFGIYAILFILGSETLLPDWFLSFVYMCAYSTCAQVPIIIMYRGVRLREEVKLIYRKVLHSVASCGGRTMEHSSSRNTINLTSGMGLDRRCSAWYIASQNPVLELNEVVNEVSLQEEKQRQDGRLSRKLLAIETCL